MSEPELNGWIEYRREVLAALRDQKENLRVLDARLRDLEIDMHLFNKADYEARVAKNSERLREISNRIEKIEEGTVASTKIKIAIISAGCSLLGTIIMALVQLFGS